MQLDSDTTPAKFSREKKNAQLMTMKPPTSELHPHLNSTTSDLDGYHHSMTADFWYTQNGGVVSKRQLHQLHDYSFIDYPSYDDLKYPVMAATANTENGLYLVPLTTSRLEPIDSAHESPPKKGIFKNLKSALFSKKNTKRPKGKQALHLPVINLSSDYNQPLFNRALTINNLRSSYSMDCLNVIENTIVWRELSDSKSLTLNKKRTESASPNNRLRHNSGSDILADVLKNNTMNEVLTHENLTQRIKMQSETTKTAQQNGVSIFAHAQKGVDSISECQSEIFFGEEVTKPSSADEKFPFRYTKHQNKNILPKYYRQQLQQKHRITSTRSECSNIPPSRLKNSLSSTSSTRSSVSSTQMQDESRLLSLSSLSLNSPQSQELLDRHFHTLGSNPSRRSYMQSQSDRWEQGHTDFTRGLSESGVSIESSDSGLGSYNGSYVAKVKRTVHFNGSDEVFEYIPINSEDCMKQRFKTGTIGIKNNGRKTKMATYL